MISHYLLSRQLQIEWTKLEIDEGGDTDFIKGMIRGLKLANAIALEMWRETKDFDGSNHPSGNKVSFYHAIQAAYAQMKIYRRHRALEILGRVIAREEAKAKRNELKSGDKI